MCYSGCPNENYHGDCMGRPTIQSHCFDGFKCTECGEIFLDTDKMSEDFENVCEVCAKSIEE